MSNAHHLRPAGLLLAILLVASATSARSQELPPDPPADTPPAPSTIDTAPAAPPDAVAGQRTASTAIVTNPGTVFTVPAVPRPSYMAPIVDPVFGTTVMRISDNEGRATAPVSGSWGYDSRHNYSKQEPWNSDASLYAIGNRSPGTPSIIILDGTTLQPKFSPCTAVGLYDYRWHPSKRHAKEMINVNSAGTELSWIDVTTCMKTRTWTLPIKADYGIGSGEGNPSNDGRYVLIGNQNQMVVVDMDPQPPYAPYPSKRIGPVYSFPPCSLGTAGCNIGNMTISPSGKYVCVKYGNSVDTTRDIIRVYEVDPQTLALAPHAMASSSFRTGSFAARPNGWIAPLKHYDVAFNPYDNNEDVAVGGNSSVDSKLGNVVMVRLRDGKVTGLSDPSNEAAFMHTSARNLDRPGWVYVSYYKQAGKRFSDEVVAVKMDGSKSVERLAHMHSATSGCYRCEQHPVPSPDGGRIIFASNWTVDCGSGCGSSSEIKDYMVITGSTVAVAGGGDDPPGRPARGGSGGLALEVLSSTPSLALPEIAYSLPTDAPARLQLFDVAGRSVLERDLAGGAGRHEMSLASEHPAAGVYWLRLTQEGHAAGSKLVILH
jgi:hypothetical protein